MRRCESARAISPSSTKARRDSACRMKLRSLAILAALVCVLFAAAGPKARVEIATHDMSDPAPRRFEATIALGQSALSILYTWTRHAR